MKHRLVEATEQRMTTLVLPKRTAQILRELTGETRPGVALDIAVRDAFAYQQLYVQSGLERFEEKYGVPFEQYRRRWETEDDEADYTWEAEQDFLEWEALITRKQRLDGLQIG